MTEKKKIAVDSEQQGLSPEIARNDEDVRMCIRQWRENSKPKD